jgi:hypothetical protein
MENPMLKMIKSQNPGKEYPLNMGKKWSLQEDISLLEALNKNIDIEIIAQKHNRTKGGIYSRCKYIAYKMYLKNISMEEIIEKTKLDEKIILKTIEKNQKIHCSTIPETKKQLPIECELAELKNEIKNLTNTIQEFVEMMKAVHEFKDA